jgi:VCBS repeat-containing protein
VSVTAGSWHENNGNAGSGGSTPNFTVDTVTPTVPAVNLDVTAGAILSANAADGVLAGATDPAPSQPLSVVAVNGAGTDVGNAVAGAYGTLTLNAEGSYSYMAAAASLPDGGAEDNFTFTVSDINGNTATATLSILVGSAGEPIIVLTAGETLNEGNDNSNSVIDARAGNETITLGNGNDVVFAAPGDMITLGNGNDTVYGSSGNTIFAGNGNDQVISGDPSTIILGNGNDTVTGGDGDKITAGNGNDSVTAGVNSAIRLGNGNDRVYAGASDLIALGNGNDWVDAGASDLITLGTGNDTVAFGLSPSPAAFGNETVNGFNAQHD